MFSSTNSQEGDMCTSKFFLCSYGNHEMEWAWMSVNWLVDEENTLHLHNGILPIHKQK